MDKDLSDIELHVAGATVRHNSPFEEFDVLINSEELDIAFIKKWVRPFYQLRFGTGDDKLKRNILSIFPEITPDIVSKLLGDFNWRTRLTGARFAAIKEYHQYEDIIGKHFLKSEVCYAGGGYCFALASFNSLKSIEYIEKYLEYYLKCPDLYFDQADAMAALSYLDDKNRTNKLQNHLSNWETFIQDKPNWNLGRHIKTFNDSMDFLHEIREGGN